MCDVIMILNVSGRTDIVAFYTKWFMNRYKEGYVMVRNPFNYHLVNEIYFEDVDLIVFCTKNPLPIIDRIKEIDKPILFHITITSYNKDIEPNVIDKSDIIEGVKELSKIIGIDNIYIRYDPIFLSDKYNIEYHIKAFNKLCSMLNGYVKHIIVSFIDDYKNVRKNNNILKIKSFTKEYICVSFVKHSIALLLLDEIIYVLFNIEITSVHNLKYSIFIYSCNSNSRLILSPNKKSLGEPLIIFLLF